MFYLPELDIITAQLFGMLSVDCVNYVSVGIVSRNKVSKASGDFLWVIIAFQ